MVPMNVIIICEFSQIVCAAFRRRGHHAYSCDLRATEGDSRYHIQADANYVLNYPQRVLGGHTMLNKHWDLMIGHPPCTYMANSGARWLYTRGTRIKVPERWAALDEAVKFMGMLWSSKIPRIALENPIMHRHARQRFGFDPTQIIQPWQFGHDETKATCLWLRGLPKLVPTKIVTGRNPRVHHASPGPDRWKERSRTLQGIADAMAEQWGGKLTL